MEKVFTSVQESLKVRPGALDDNKDDNLALETGDDVESKEDGAKTKLFAIVGETLRHVAISIAFKKSLQILAEFPLPLSENDKNKLPENIPRLLPPGCLWEEGNEEIKQSMTEVVLLLRQAGTEHSPKLIEKCEQLSTLCLAWRLGGEGGIECISILTENGKGGYHGVGLNDLMSECGYQELIAKTSQEMHDNLKADREINLSMASLYRSQDTEFNSRMSAFLINACSVIGGYFKI